MRIIKTILCNALVILVLFSAFSGAAFAENNPAIHVTTAERHVITANVLLLISEHAIIELITIIVGGSILKNCHRNCHFG